MFHRIFIVLAIGAILMGLASTTFVWAAPGTSPAGQTVPTRTPVAPPKKEEKDKPTPTPTLVIPTLTPLKATATPAVTVVKPVSPQTLPTSSLATVPPGWMAGTITRVPSTSTVTPTVAITLPMETATGLPSLTPTLAGAAPAQIATRVASDTAVPLPTSSPTRETSAPNGVRLLWLIGLVPIAGGAAWVLMRFRGTSV